MRLHTAETQATMTPEKALQFLKEGNGRFVQNLKVQRNLLDQAAQYSYGQYPFAIILSCMDSRTSAELIFDQGLGDVFSVRVAGNVLNDDIIGSMEYACKAVGSKLIMILGHSKCGATAGACAEKEIGNLTQLLRKMTPSVDKVKLENATYDPSSAEFVDEVSRQHVLTSMDELLERSEVLREMFVDGKIGIVGAYHEIATGEVKYLREDMPSELLEEAEAILNQEVHA